jgi:hypothetical protein
MEGKIHFGFVKKIDIVILFPLSLNGLIDKLNEVIRQDSNPIGQCPYKNRSRHQCDHSFLIQT